jgi:ElaB/YqjD/DUF883 family membrane-anchored ribosome-binding protein
MEHQMNMREKDFDRAAAQVKQKGEDIGDTIRDMIESEPYKAVMIAVGVGWLLGRIHKPF